MEINIEGSDLLQRLMDEAYFGTDRTSPIKWALSFPWYRKLWAKMTRKPVCYWELPPGEQRSSSCAGLAAWIPATYEPAQLFSYPHDPAAIAKPR